MKVWEALYEQKYAAVDSSGHARNPFMRPNHSGRMDQTKIRALAINHAQKLLQSRSHLSQKKESKCFAFRTQHIKQNRTLCDLSQANELFIDG